MAFVCPSKGAPPQWDVRVIDLIRALRGEEHRTLDTVQTDWLAVYLKENP